MGGNSSLARRLFLSATAVSVVFLAVIGILLSTLYRNSVERAFDRRLNLYLRNIVAEVANNPRPPLSEPETLGEPLFLIPNSGWYWQILRMGENGETKLSRSTPDEGLVTLLAQNVKQRKDGLRQGYMRGPDGQRLRVVERLLDIGDDGRFLITVSGDSVEIDEEAAEFNYALFITFALLALAFILTVGFQVRYGLRPLSRISGALSEIRSGRAERLAGDFPREIDPLAREVNALLESNREIAERARTHVGNLAHALKTPLSVLMNEAGHVPEPGGEKIREQLNVMRDQVTRHLERARIAARTVVVSTTIDVGPVVATIARTMEKIHRERGVSIHARTDESVKFRGEQQDLEEMLGNLVDNACKWATSRIDVELHSQPVPRGEGNAFFRLQVDDDGPGLAPNEREEVLRRGRRLDESKPGTGLGLSIVLDLAKLYGGSLELGNSPLGGLRAALLLPAVPA